MGHKELRDRLSRELNAALSTCDRTGRKRASGDLVIGVRLADDPDGKLGSWIDDDTRLKLQKRRWIYHRDLTSVLHTRMMGYGTVGQPGEKLASGQRAFVPEAWL